MPANPPEPDRTSAGQGALVCARGLVADGAIRSDLSLSQLRALLDEGRIVILKGVFSREEILAYRAALTRWHGETEEYPHGRSPNETPEQNYYRTDRGEFKSAIPHIFRQFGFNSPDHLPAYVGAPTRRIANLLLRLQNDLAGTDFDLSITGMRIKLLHYPAGGGFLTEHVHPREPQRIGLIASLSRVGEDLASGGTAFKTPFGRVDTLADHDIGDVILFRYDLPHAVDPVDPQRELDWNSEAGKWSFVLDLRETHGLSHVKQAS